MLDAPDTTPEDPSDLTPDGEVGGGAGPQSPGQDGGQDDGWIRVVGARQNNLKGVDVAFPKGQLTVVTGVSGSGKSSLCFDTLYAEGQRRYVESFSTYARQFLERMDRPDVDRIDGLVPAVALEQRQSIRSARSTLGTLTELTDHLKVLFKSLATLHCDVCGEPVHPDLPGPTIERLLRDAGGKRVVVTFPFRAGEGVDAEVAFRYLGGQGFRRALGEGGRVVDVDTLDPEAPKTWPRGEVDPEAAHGPSAGTLDVVVDRLKAEPEERQRLVEALELAYRHGEDEAALFVEAPSPDGGRRFERWTLAADHRHCGRRYPAATEGTFSFNSPIGACKTCNGFGRIMGIDVDRVVPDGRKTLRKGAIKPWTQSKRSWERKQLRGYCEQRGIDLDTPWKDLPEEHRRLVLEGEVDKVGWSWVDAWPGVLGWFRYLEKKTYKMHVRILLARYRAYLTCPDCGGTRFEAASLRWRLGDLTISETLRLTVRDARKWLEQIYDAAPEGTREALTSVFAELGHRLTYLDRVGLDYLTLDRQGRTLSGGEIQRANLTTAVGSGLVNTLFVLDEPTIGLHPRDTERLSGLLSELTRRDNTVVLVEHDPDVLDIADHVVDMGPGPGASGGTVVFSGAPATLADCEASVTRAALVAREAPREPRHVDCADLPGMTIRGARAQNLQDVTVQIPYGKLTVLTGVSGSGKSTLMGEVLHRGMLRRRGQVTDPPGACDALEGVDGFADVVWVDQASPASSPRANAATYVKAWDGFRKLFASQPLSEERGYTPGTFSFNTGKGRCPACEGAGFERVEMQFLSDVLLTCQVCEGKRFKPDVLEVTWEGHTVADVLELTVSEAIAALPKRSAARKRLQHLDDVGLGYLTLGQPLATLSGGEAQRLKVAHHLGLAKTTKTLFLFDEPTTGLHLADVDVLVRNLRALADRGNTVLVIEHHLDVIAEADHVVELGPEAGDRGGQKVFEGPPAALVAQAEDDGQATHTGRHLRRWLSGATPLSAFGRETLANRPRVRDDDDATTRPADPDVVEVEGARVHNLKDVYVRLPRTGRTVVSGVSGSGKSSLAFDLVFSEGQRRFLDCLSPYARQYIGQLGRPDADRIAGIPPTVAIEQRTTRGGARSLVANVTEIEPFLRLLWARLGVDPTARAPVDPVVAAAEFATRFAEQGVTELMVRGMAVSARKGFHKPVFVKARRLGHKEILVDGEIRGTRGTPRLKRHSLHTIEFVTGRVTLDGTAKAKAALVRLVEDAALCGKGLVAVSPTGELDPVLRMDVLADEEDAARAAYRRTWDPRLFSPMTEIGACPRCEGRGEIDVKGSDEPLVCPACHGERLGPVGRRITFGGKTLPQVLAMTPPELRAYLDSLVLDSRAARVSEAPVKAIDERARFLEDVGLAYLGLDRRVRTLSGGEAQRIRLASQLGAQLSGVLYVLDEPTIGLHPTDTERLLEALDRLETRGNGVLMVEHDEATLRTADVLVDIGPGAGVEGGRVLACGPLEAVLQDAESVTAQCLREPRPPVAQAPRSVAKKATGFIELSGLRHHNLRDQTVRIPRERLTVVTGVSGSGKSSLVEALKLALDAEGPVGGVVKGVKGLDGLARLIEVDDKPIGKNPRSTPATYVGIWDAIRKLFAGTPEARLRGYGPGRFSFNVKDGRCPACDGNGAIKLEMSFLPDAYAPCEVCGGKRYSSQTLQITYAGHTIHDVLAMPVREAKDVFERVSKVRRALELLDDVGLGYLTLGQPSPTLSGGESQRIKLVSELLGRGRHDTVVVLDEPSIGLHMADVPKLLGVVHRLVDAGATVVVVEHNPDVMREADWVVDLGPGAGVDGGHVLYQGPWKALTAKAAKGSRTAEWLRANPDADPRLTQPKPKAKATSKSKPKGKAK